MTVQCALCGHENELGRMFCVGCGQRLQFNAPDAMSFKNQPRPFPWGRLWRIFLLMLLLLAISAGLLAVLPPADLGGATDSEGGRAVEERILAVRSSVCVGGPGAEVEVTEAALNGWLSNCLVRTHSEPIAVRMAAGDLTFEGVSRFRFTGAAGRYVQMSFPLTLRLGMHLQSGRLDLDRASVGLLPLPGRLGDPVRKWFSARIAPLWRELRLETIVRAVEIQPGRALLRLDHAP